MDLLNHIAGVGPTGAVNPGATTPAPYNTPHVGGIDGVGPGTATKNMAEIYNRDLLWRRALIAEAGLAFDPTNWVQEVQAIKLLISLVGSAYANAAGTADAITADFAPDITSLAQPFTVFVRAGFANQTTTPNFKADGTAIQTIVKGANQALSIGDIPAAGFWMELRNDPTLGKYVLQNPATGVQAQPALKNGLVNGGCQIAQQAAVNLTTTATYGAVDMFAAWGTGTAVTAGTIAQDTASPIGRTGFAHKLAGVTVTGAGVVFSRQRIAALKAKRFKNQTASFSVLVHHDTGANVNYVVNVRKPTVADNWTASTVIATSPASVVPTATGTLLNFSNIAMGDCSNGIEVEVQAQCGAVVTKNFSFTEWLLEEGISATSFPHIGADLEIIQCKWYFNAGFKSYMTITGTAGAGFSCPISFSEMRATPTALNTAFYLNPTASTSPSFLPQSPSTGAAGCVFAVNGAPTNGIITDLSARL